MTESPLYFDITENDNLIRITVINQPYPDSEIDYDRNWLRGSVKFNLGAFNGEYFADFQTFDFETFRKELEIAYDKLNRNAMFDTIENQVKIHLNGNGSGHFEVKYWLMDKAGVGNELRGEMKIDQTQLPEIISHLNEINKQYPPKR